VAVGGDKTPFRQKKAGGGGVRGSDFGGDFFVEDFLDRNGDDFDALIQQGAPDFALRIPEGDLSTLEE
jgi:hypothetical protein